jgi:hypothetical protein
MPSVRSRRSTQKARNKRERTFTTHRIRATLAVGRRCHGAELDRPVRCAEPSDERRREPDSRASRNKWARCGGHRCQTRDRRPEGTRDVPPHAKRGRGHARDDRIRAAADRARLGQFSTPASLSSVPATSTSPRAHAADHLSVSRSFLIFAATPAFRSATSLIVYSTELPNTMAISEGVSW